MNDRLKKLREELELSMEAFANKIGVSRPSISRLESGDMNFTERMIKSICREFNVDYLWFTQGDGEMFIRNEDSVLGIIDKIMCCENDFHKNVFKMVAEFDDEDLAALERLINKFSAIKKADD